MVLSGTAVVGYAAAVVTDACVEAYRTGRGSVTMRAVVAIDEDDKGRTIISITELPYQVNPDNLAEKIADLAITGGTVAGTTTPTSVTPPTAGSFDPASIVGRSFSVNASTTAEGAIVQGGVLQLQRPGERHAVWVFWEGPQRELAEETSLTIERAVYRLTANNRFERDGGRLANAAQKSSGPQHCHYNERPANAHDRLRN